jgi:hypothetical protein
MPTGRPRKEWKPASLVSSVESGASVDVAARRLGITGRTVARFAAEHPEFAAELNQARATRDARYARGAGPAVGDDRRPTFPTRPRTDAQRPEFVRPE